MFRAPARSSNLKGELALNLQKLRALHSVIVTGSVTGAATRLHLTQPAVSRSLSALEAELGFKLFNRLGGRLVPTPQGEAFSRECERILLDIDDLTRIGKEIRANRGGRLRIVAMPQLARSLLVPALAQFSKEFPSVSISLEVRERREVERWASGLRFDVGIVMLPTQFEMLTSHSFAELVPVAVLHPDHPLAANKTILPSDLIEDRFIALDRTTLLRQIVDGMYVQAGLAANIWVEVSSAFIACQMVGAGMGVSISDPFSAALLAERDVVVRPCKTSARLNYAFVYPRHSKKTAQAVRFSEIVRSTLENLMGRFEFVQGQTIR